MKPVRLSFSISTAALLVGSAVSLLSQTKEPPSSPLTTTAIVLGVGSPDINAERSGTSIGIIVAGTMYLFDAGAGVERRIMEAGPKLAALHVERLGPVFLTHLHMDHTLGLAALLYYHNIVGGRLVGSTPSTPLAVYGPGPTSGPPLAERAGIGTSAVMDHLVAAFAQPPRASGIDLTNLPDGTPSVRSFEIAPGVVYRDANVTVTAFDVAHKTALAYGFRIQTADRAIVVSGDTRPVDAVIDACNGCDLLFHEVFGVNFGPGGPKNAAQGHTSAVELGELARRARPKHLVAYHSVQISEKVFQETVGKSFSGKATLARDLDIF